MTFLNTRKIPLISIASFLAIAIFCICIVISSIQYLGSYSIIENWISDLGSSAKNPEGSIFFNAGCILTGFAVILFDIGLGRWKKLNGEQNNLFLLCQCLGFLMALALIMVGIFPEDYGTMHYLSAAAFFLLMFIFLIITNMTLKKSIKYDKVTWYFAHISIAISFIFLLTSGMGIRLPVLEWSAVLSGLIWIGLVGYNSLKLEV
jgi:hypothetical membrane protein